MAVRPTSTAARPTRSAGQRYSHSGKVNPVQVDQKLIDVGDVLLDERSTPVRHIRIDFVHVGAKSERTITGVDLLSNTPVTLNWSWCLTYELVIAGPKFDQVQANPDHYTRMHQGRRIWKPQETVA